MYFKEVRDADLWRKIQVTMMEAMGIFVFTIFIGILNAVDLVEFNRAELLFHLHSGVLGWISMSSVALIIWYFVGDRDLDEQSKKTAFNILRYVTAVIPAYVVLFYLGFSLAFGYELLGFIPVGDGSKYWFILLVVGAIAAFSGFAWTLYFGYTELRKIEVVTTSHWLFLGAMFTSTYGGIFGFVLELQNFLGRVFYNADAGQDGTAAHAAAMEAGYLYMMLAAILEWQILGDKKPIGRLGWIQTIALALAGLFVSLGAGFNIIVLATLNMPLLLIGFGLLVYRVLRKIDPRSVIGNKNERFFLPAGLFMAFSVFFFLYLVSKIVGGADPNELFNSPWMVGLFLSNNHSLFVGAMTGVIFSSILVMFKETGEEATQLENIGFGLMYVGLLGFVLTLIIRGNARENGDSDLSDLRTDIASVMGIGLYTFMFSLFKRFRSIKPV